mmetsp:Transcript_89396/g.239111  ORF Transcript_89396/g.239111 Transcript_89396/m.239111 type:complete len:278 (+) Transcript_89396:427-1260(+)
MDADDPDNAVSVFHRIVHFVAGAHYCHDSPDNHSPQRPRRMPRGRRPLRPLPRRQLHHLLLRPRHPPPHAHPRHRQRLARGRAVPPRPPGRTPLHDAHLDRHPHHLVPRLPPPRHAPRRRDALPVLRLRHQSRPLLHDPPQLHPHPRRGPAPGHAGRAAGGAQEDHRRPARRRRGQGALLRRHLPRAPHAAQRHHRPRRQHRRRELRRDRGGGARPAVHHPPVGPAAVRAGQQHPRLRLDAGGHPSPRRRRGGPALALQDGGGSDGAPAQEGRRHRI